jgi:hypothetical protein
VLVVLFDICVGNPAFEAFDSLLCLPDTEEASFEGPAHSVEGLEFLLPVKLAGVATLTPYSPGTGGGAELVSMAEQISNVVQRRVVDLVSLLDIQYVVSDGRQFGRVSQRAATR